ncbi:SMP-30/gluconolactonase/LRE family protein [Streptomyces sp. NPDC021622]|uniref:SMP-30/gluconolactonase/LRE family protein n=1 Tax=Streptomyces sp. NPDC021622 TaxID=3155013 RepID=UPI0033E29CAB
MTRFQPPRAEPRPLVVRHRIFVGRGPEHVAPDGHGRLLTGVEDGRILRVDPAPPHAVEQVGRTGGRPLGLIAQADGCILVCDAERGLLRLSPDAGLLEVLADRIGGEPLRLCSNVAVGADDTVYFTSSSSRYPLSRWRSDLLEHTASGRALRLTPGGIPEVLAEGLEFANGVVLAPDSSHLVVAETGTRRLMRLWLTGPGAGRLEVFLDDLPGYPDNLTQGPSGDLWVALAAPPNPWVESLRSAPAGLRRAMATAAYVVRPRPPRVARVLSLTPEGRVRHDLRRSGRGCRMVTSATETRGELVLGSLMESHLTVCEPPRESGEPRLTGSG